MRKLLSVLIIAFCSAAALAQTPSPTPVLYSKQTLSDLRKLQSAALKSDYALQQAAYLSNNIGPRLSGSNGAARAVEYVAQEMRRQGFAVTLQPIMVPHWERGAESGELVEWNGMGAGTVQKIVLAALGGSVATPPAGITADVVVVSSFEELESLGKKGVQGKIVLFNGKFDKRLADSGYGSAAYGLAVRFRGAGPSAAARLGAAAVLIRSAGGSQNRLAHTGSTRYADDAPKIPAASIPFEDAELIAHLTAMGKVRMKLVLTPQTYPDAPSHNVIADLKGTEKPDEIVIVSGHLDSWDLGTGAIDDAAGVAVSMQVLHLVKALRLKPKRTIRFIAYMNEENGLVGGTEYAKVQEANIGKHFAAIESDLGASHPLGFYYAAKPEAAPFLAPLSELLRLQGAPMMQAQPGGVGADIGPLTQRGVPSFAPFFNTQSYFNYHHTAADTFDKIVPEELAEVGALNVVLAYGLANLEQPLPR